MFGMHMTGNNVRRLYSFHGGGVAMGIDRYLYKYRVGHKFLLSDDALSIVAFILI